MGIANYQEQIDNPIFGKTIKGFIDGNKLSDIKTGFSTVTIPNGMEYRPDLIADYFLGDKNKAWMLYYVNGFINGLKDFKGGRIIRIPN